MMDNIIDLRETQPDKWQAKYQGNYGIYTIRIRKKGEKTIDFSCSCPSDYYPCKHIPIVEDAIKEHIRTINIDPHEPEDNINVENILKSVAHKELKEFITRLAKYNEELTNSIILEFAEKVRAKNKKKNEESEDGNVYSLIIRKGLKKEKYDLDYIYDYDYGIEIDIMDEWLTKAAEHYEQGNYNEAILICKACIEEYAVWLQKADSYVIDYVNPDYQTMPFELLGNITDQLNNSEKDELWTYYREESLKEKYLDTDMADNFYDLMSHLGVADREDEFIDIQNQLLNKINDKNSYEAEVIIGRMIQFYRNASKPEMARKLIEENVQFETFREELVKNLISEKRFTEAKQLILKYAASKDSFYYRKVWDEYLLEIAKKEKNIPSIRALSLQLMENRFDNQLYKDYKSTFDSQEWPDRMEKLIKNYQKSTLYFNHNVASIYITEKDNERLIKYVENYLSVEIIESYYTYFVSEFPEKTISLLRQSIDKYAENTGRNYYEHIAGLLKKMSKIPGGSKIVKEMVGQYRILYKKRRAMMEILNRL